MKARHITTLLILTLGVTTLAAQNTSRKSKHKRPQTTTAVQPTAEAPKSAPKPEAEVAVPQPLTPRYKYNENLTQPFSPAQMDSLLAIWKEGQTIGYFNSFFDTYIDINGTSSPQSNVPDSVYENRLKALVSPIHLPFNPIVKTYITRYVDTRHGTINRILSKSQYYFPIIEEELIKNNLPVELRALPVIESALSFNAISPVGAAGLWQFMPKTGKNYGLEVNSLVDERYDPLLATKAACRYLKDMFDIFHDWTLAIAAYNCGSGNVNKAISRAGNNCHTFWDIYNYLPRETRGYVPAFIGASYAYAYHKQHGIEINESPMPLATDTIHVNRLMHLQQIATTIDLPIDILRSLNPQYKLDIIPATTKSYTLILPQVYISQYISKEQEIFAKDTLYLKEYLNNGSAPAAKTVAAAQSSVAYHVVRKGETLGAIASRYHVKVSQLMKWNRLSNAHKLSLGQRLRIEGR